MRAYACPGAGLYGGAVLERGLGSAEAKIAGGGAAVAHVLEFVEVGVRVVPKGAVEFLRLPVSLSGGDKNRDLHSLDQRRGDRSSWRWSGLQ